MDKQVATVTQLDQEAFNQAMNAFLSHNGGVETTKKTYRKALRRFLLWLEEQPTQDQQHPTTQTIEHYRDDLAHTASAKTGKNLSPKTVDLYLIAVERYFQYLVDTHVLLANPAKGVKLLKVDKTSYRGYLSTNQVKEVLDAMDKDTSVGKRDYALMSLLFACGLRTVEVNRARVCDITYTAAGKLILKIQGKGRTSKGDFVNLPRPVYMILRDYLATRGISSKDIASCDEPLFTSTSNRAKGKSLSTRTINTICHRAFEAAGFDQPNLSAHSTRHSLAINELRAGKSITDVQAALRHKSPATTAIYAHQVDKEENTVSADFADALWA